MNNRIAPERPTTAELLDTYRLTEFAVANIAEQRRHLGQINNGQSSDLLAIVGACTMTSDTYNVASESYQLGTYNSNTDNALIINRAVPSKFRSDENAPHHGLETVDPELAMGMMTSIVKDSVKLGITMEIIHDYHPRRYGHLLTLGWFGARTGEDATLAMATEFLETNPDATAPIKNDLSGGIDKALRIVNILNSLAPSGRRASFLIYRGGEDAKDPDSWEAKYREAYEKTEGQFVVDVAHGSEMAHHLSGKFKKSVDGQREAMDHVIQLAEDEGIMPMGIMIEGSDQKDIVDPNMPLQDAIDGVQRLAKLAA